VIRRRRESVALGAPSNQVARSRAALVGVAVWAATSGAGAASEPGVDAGLALRVAKALVVGVHGDRVHDDVWVLVRDGRIEGILDADSEQPEAGYVCEDLGDRWLMPGMIDLHSHVGGSFDINDGVYQSNSDLRVTPAVVPGNDRLRRALASGVTTVLFIPGSATTVGGQGVLIRTGFDRYEQMLVRDPGALKVAQADNPKRWGYGMNRFARGEGPEPRIDLQLEIFRDLVGGRAQIATHTQVAQVVLASIQIMVVEHGLPMFIDHGSFDAWRIASVAEGLGVPAILGPRNFSSEVPGRGIDADVRIDGIAGRYQEQGHSTIGFNTDAPVVPQEELSLQAAIGARLGLEDAALETVRGLTIVPARTVGIDHKVGSIHPGKEADLVLVTGHPADPRTRVDRVWLQGELVYDAESHGRWW
jgi:imidazolonepropionase-like amidohydrolase